MVEEFENSKENRGAKDKPEVGDHAFRALPASNNHGLLVTVR